MANVTVIGGSHGAGQATSEASSRQDGTTLNYHHPVGTRAIDASGNEYVYVEFGQAVYGGVVVGITPNYLVCIPFVDQAHQGPVGVVQGTMTSDQAGWVMVRGTTDAQLAGADSAATSAYRARTASSVSSPATALAATSLNDTDPYSRIHGMWVTGAAETGTTAATSHTGVYVPVHLNYPFVSGEIEQYSSV